MKFLLAALICAAACWGETASSIEGRAVNRISGVPPGRYFLHAEPQGGIGMIGEIRSGASTENRPEEAYVGTYYRGSRDLSAAAPVEVSSGEQHRGIDIRMQKSAVYHVRGAVAGASMSTRMMLLPLTPGNYGAEYGDMLKADKTFDIAGIGQGTFARTLVTVGNRDLNDVSITLVPGAEIKGVLRLVGVDGSLRPVDPGLRMALMPVKQTMSIGSVSTVNDEGAFSFPKVGADRYRFYAYSFNSQLYLKSVKLGSQEVLESEIEWSQGASGTLQVTMSNAAGEIDGVVQNEKGERWRARQWS